MAISVLKVAGLRGLAMEQTLKLAQPSGQPGSGLTVLVGSNNAGKTSLIEAFRLLTQSQPPSLSEGRRNKTFGDKVTLRLENHHNLVRGLTSISAAGSETEWIEGSASELHLFVLPSRRTFNAYFSDMRAGFDRNGYVRNYSPAAMKSATIDSFAGRLFMIARDADRRRRFNEMLGQVVSEVPDWTIDQVDSGQFYLKFRSGLHTHSSEGLGEGLVSLFFIIDSLYDSVEGSLTVIDEPELSLHPEFQRRLRALLSGMATDRQIVYATHSPYFVSWDDVAHGATIARVHKSADGTEISQPSSQTLSDVARLRLDANNPHVTGLDASEVFFLEDRVLLVEGQEDVIFYRKLLGELQISWRATFFGWGVGGAEKMRSIALLLHELGYTAVVGLLDADKTTERDSLSALFPAYLFKCIPANDVRTKKARPATPEKRGLLDDAGGLRSEFEGATRDVFASATAYFHGETSATLRV